MEGKAEFTSGALTVYDASNILNGYPAAAHTAAPVNPTIDVEGPSMADFPPPDNSDGAVLSPDPISAIPLLPEFPTEKRASKSDSETPADDPSPFQRGRDFTPHIITVYAGEDVGKRIMSAGSRYRAISVLSANGSISLATISRPEVAGGIAIYEGHFDIVSLNGLFVPTKNGSLMCKSGGLSVYLVDGEGKTIAGGLAGMLIAKSNVVVTVATFLPNGSNQRKRKRAETEPSSALSLTMGPPLDKVSMGPPRDKVPMNPDEGQMPGFSPASPSQVGPSAQHGLSQDNRDLGAGNRPSAVMQVGEINGSGQSEVMNSG